MTSAFVISLRTDGFLVQIAISFCLWPFSTYSCVLSTQARSTRKMKPKEQPFKDDDWEVVHKYPTLLTSQWGQLLMHSLLAIGSLLSPTQVCTALSFSLSHFTIFTLVHPKVSSQMNFHSNLCLRAYFSGNQTKDSSIMFFLIKEN